MNELLPPFEQRINKEETKMDENSTTYYAHTKLIKLESRLSAVIAKLDKLYSVRLEMIGVLPESVVANASDEILLLQERAHELRENIRRELEEGAKNE